MSAPLTFLFDFGHGSDKMRRYVMSEFARCGAKHLVLTDTLLSQCLQHYQLIGDLAREMADVGLTFVDAHCPFGPRLDLNTPDAADRRRAVALQRHVFEIIAELGVKTTTIHVGNNHWMPDVADRDEAENLKRVREQLAILLPEAEKSGIQLAIENIWFQINTPEHLLEIKADFPTESLGFCYDAGHANLMASNIPENRTALQAWEAVNATPKWETQALEKMLPYVITCHLHDNDGTDDRHTLPGRGTIDWPHIVKLLHQAPRLKCIQSEVIPVRENILISDLCAKFRELFPAEFEM